MIKTVFSYPVIDLKEILELLGRTGMKFMKTVSASAFLRQFGM
jgi:hypothetical protein